MKNADQATKRPWVCTQENVVKTGDYDVAEVYGPQREERIANAKLIVQAVNEYAALCAVADAAEWLSIAIAENKVWGQPVEAVNEAIIKLGDTLAALAKIRGGAK